MKRTEFWILNATSILVAVLFLTQILLARATQAETLQLTTLERLINQGQAAHQRFQQVGLRVFQLSQQDPNLQQLLQRQKINVTNSVNTDHPVPSPVSSSSAQPN